MKSILSIPLILLVFFTGIKVEFASHFCGGQFAAMKVSLTGEPATCGMENHPVTNSVEQVFTKKCCEDKLSVYSIENNYFPSSFSFNDSFRQVVNVTVDPAIHVYGLLLAENNLLTLIRPPGIYAPNRVSLSNLCVFRI